MRRLNHIRAVWGTGRKLGLSFLNRLKFIVASTQGLGKRLRGWGIGIVYLRLRERGKTITLPIRLNGADYTLAEEIFGNRSYDVAVGDVKTILDLGGNIGFATLLFHVRFPEAAIATVEPVPAFMAILRRTVSLNRIPATLFEAAVGIEDGAMKLFVSSNQTSSSFTLDADADGKEISVQQISVQQISVPSVMKKMGWNHIDLLKVDIEGYEKTLFSSHNEWLRCVDVIVGEAHSHVQYRLPDLIHDLAPFGFVVTQKVEDTVYGLIIFEARRAIAA